MPRDQRQLKRESMAFLWTIKSSLNPKPREKCKYLERVSNDVNLMFLCQKMLGSGSLSLHGEKE